MIRSLSESQQTQTFSIDHANVLPEHYRLIELIGRGGMAEVYLAEDRRLGRKVAIKFLNSEFRRDPDRVRRFRQEARSASALNHPNILIIHDIGDCGGVQFIVSEFVEGETLGARIAQGRVPFTEAVDIAIQAVSALTAAHAAGIVHRDIKPDNIMIRLDGAVKVLDFGLAKSRGFTTANGAEFDALTLDSGSTSPGLIVGTPQYMSPEQARGKELDGRTDIFSLGIILFEMVTRHSPFASGSFADTMAAILTKEPRRMDEFVDDAPARLVELVDKCLMKDRDERFASMAALETELKLLRSELVVHPKDTAEVDPAKSDRTQIRTTHQHSIRGFVSNTFHKPSPIAAVIILLAAGLLAGGWWAWDRVASSAGPPALMKMVPITSWAGSTGESPTSASFSPDGRMIAYSALTSGATEIWVKPTDVGDPIQITRSGSTNLYPVWSADNREIAFLSQIGGVRGFWRVAYTGGNQREIATGFRGDTRLILWGQSGNIYFEEAGELFSVDSASGERVRITDFAGSDLKPWRFEISKNESKVAYSIKEGDVWRIYVADRGKGDRVEFASSPFQLDHLAWDTNGATLVYSAQTDERYQIFQSTGPGTQLQISNSNSDVHVQDVSPDGERMLFSFLAETSDIWKVDVQTGKESTVANSVYSELWPDFSKDGASIVFQSGEMAERPYSTSLKVESADRGPVTVSESGFLPSWSPDGQSIAFLRKTGGAVSLWRVGRHGENAKMIADENLQTPGYTAIPYLKQKRVFSWSPDSSQIAFSKKAVGISNIWLSGVVGEQKVTTNTDDRTILSSPKWTSDGNRIVFYQEKPNASMFRLSVNDLSLGQERILFESASPFLFLGLANAGREAIIVQKLESSSLAQISSVEVFSLQIASGNRKSLLKTDNVYFHNIYLSHDGGSIAFVSKDDGMSILWTLQLSEGKPRQILVENDPKTMISSLAWSNDSKFIAYGKETRTHSISMLSK